MIQLITPIVICGVARAGKTTLSNSIVQYMQENKHLNVHTQQLSFAGPIKQGLAEMGVTKENHPELYRYLAQECGDGCRKKGTPTWWTDRMLENLERYNREMKTQSHYRAYAIIDDCRYDNELLLIRKTYPDSVVVFIDASNRIDTDIINSPMYAHPSEKMAVSITRSIQEDASLRTKPSYFGVDYIIDNNRDMPYFSENISKFISFIEPVLF